MVRKIYGMTCWIAEDPWTFNWALQNIESCRNFYAYNYFPVEEFRRNVIEVLVKHAMRQASKDAGHIYRRGELMVSYEPARSLEIRLELDNKRKFHYKYFYYLKRKHERRNIPT